MQTPLHDHRKASTGLETLSVLWKRRRFLAICVFTLAFVAVGSLVFSLPDVYTATATILVNQGTAPAPQDAAVPQNRLDSVSEQVLSRERLLDLITRYGLYPHMRSETSNETVLARMRSDIRLDRKVEDQQQWGQDPTFAFTLSYQGWDPQVVARVTNALAGLYVDENNKMRTSQASETVSSLAAQLAQIKQKLDSQAQAVNSFETAHVGELPQQEAANLATLQQLNTELQQSISNEMLADGRSGVAPAETQTTDLAQLEQQLAALRSRYTDRYPDVVRLETQIATLKRAKANGSDKTAGAATDAHAGEPGGYAAEQKRLRGEIAIYQQRIDNIPLLSQQLQALTQGYNETQDVYSSLLKRYEQARLAEAPQAGLGGQYRVLEPAVVPTDASGPARMRLLAIGLILCLALSAAAVFTAEQFDTSFHTVDELRSFTRVPVLASIPMIVTPRDVWKRRLRLTTAAASLVVALGVVAGVSHFVGHGNQALVWSLSRHHS
ncbi:MAG: GumC family protein [Bacillota bacterium]